MYELEFVRGYDRADMEIDYIFTHEQGGGLGEDLGNFPFPSYISIHLMVTETKASQHPIPPT